MLNREVVDLNRNVSLKEKLFGQIVLCNKAYIFGSTITCRNS